MTYPFERLNNAFEIIEALNDIPDDWSLTPVWDKAPKRDNWQTESKLDKGAIANLIFNGESKISKNGNSYQYFASGYGLRTGEYSHGILAVDIDGETALPILYAIGYKNEITVSWTSGKSGRFQLLFQIPDSHRQNLKDFRRKVLTQWKGLECAKTTEIGRNGKTITKYIDGLEFRYNEAQSVIPPSRHPTTGAYRWLHDPLTTEIAIAPQWLLDFLDKIAVEPLAIANAVDWTQYKKTVAKGLSASTNLNDFLLFDVYPRLSPNQIFNWTGHNFKQVGKTLKGYPPWRQSASGTSFHAWQDKDGQWAWQDKQTGEGGGAIAYRHKLSGGNGKPRGKDFVAIVRELAGDAGLQLPDYVPDTIKIAETKIAHNEEEIIIADANADILRWVVAGDETAQEKRDMITSLTEVWEPHFKTEVWGHLEPEARTQIKILLK
jgi:Bifunctional DNA primase/polymerase, N-terminal